MNCARFISRRFFLVLPPLVAIACAAEPAQEAADTTQEAVLCSIVNPQPGCSPGVPPKCGVLGGACCPAEGGTCLASYATCSAGRCVECGGPGEIACPGGVCFSGSDINGVCLSCSSVSNSAPSVVTGPTQATVAFTSSAAFSTAVSLVNTNNLTDKHEVFGPSATTSNVVVTGLSPATSYFLVLTPAGCGVLPQTATANATLDVSRVEAAQNISGLNASSLTFQNGASGAEAVLAASPALVKLMPSLSTAPLSFALPSATLSVSSPQNSYATTFTGLSASLDATSIFFNVNELDVVVSFNATLFLRSLNSSLPSPTLTLTGAQADVELGFSPLTQEFFVQSVSVDLEDHITSCGFAGPCTGVFNSAVATLDAPLIQAITGVLTPAVDTPAVTTATETVFAQVNTSVVGPPIESVVPGSLFYTTTGGDSEFGFNVQWITNSVQTVTTTAQ